MVTKFGFDKETQDQIQAVKLFHGSPEQKAEVLILDLLSQTMPPVCKVMTEEEMGIGWDRKYGPYLWFNGTPKPGMLYHQDEVIKLLAQKEAILQELRIVTRQLKEEQARQFGGV